jgi:hypothetical protein
VPFVTCDRRSSPADQHGGEEDELEGEAGQDGTLQDGEVLAGGLDVGGKEATKQGGSQRRRT